MAVKAFKPEPWRKKTVNDEPWGIFIVCPRDFGFKGAVKRQKFFDAALKLSFYFGLKGCAEEVRGLYPDQPVGETLRVRDQKGDVFALRVRSDPKRPLNLVPTEDLDNGESCCYPNEKWVLYGKLERPPKG